MQKLCRVVARGTQIGKNRLSTAAATTEFATMKTEKKRTHVPKSMSKEQRHVVADEIVEENGGLLEYSVVYSDRALNSMSSPFQEIMRELHVTLTRAYNTDHMVMLPGSGTYGMEAAARAFAFEKKALVIRNGYFSFRWSQIFETLGKSSDDVTVLKARPLKTQSSECACNPGTLCGSWQDAAQLPCFVPPPIEEVVATIYAEKPSFIAMPHVETSAGMILPDEYIKSISTAAHEIGAIVCLDGVASGTAWVDMSELGVDCYITAPQKGWSGPAAVGVIMLSDRGLEAALQAKQTSFTVDIGKWHGIMKTYLGGGFGYWTTMPTDAIRKFRDVVRETHDFGLKNAESEAWRLGMGVRDVLKSRGFRSVAAKGYEAPGVAVVHAGTSTPFAPKFAKAGLQIAAGVPLHVDEPTEHFHTFRLGLFGLDKLRNVDLTIANFTAAFDKVLTDSN